MRFPCDITVFLSFMLLWVCRSFPFFYCPCSQFSSPFISVILKLQGRPISHISISSSLYIFLFALYCWEEVGLIIARTCREVAEGWIGGLALIKTKRKQQPSAWADGKRRQAFTCIANELIHTRVRNAAPSSAAEAAVTSAAAANEHLGWCQLSAFGCCCLRLTST